MRMKLTDQAINKDATADGKRRELADAGCPGLRIRITPSGNRSWILGVRDKLGNARRFPLGNFPGMGLADAREAARDMHHKVKRGGADPIADKRRYLAILSLAELLRQADTYPYPKSAAFAVRTLRPVLKWGSQPGRFEMSSDLVRLNTPTTITARERVLTNSELRATLPLLRNLESAHARMLRFLLLTLARRKESGSAGHRAPQPVFLAVARGRQTLDRGGRPTPPPGRGYGHRRLPRHAQPEALEPAEGRCRPDRRGRGHHCRRSGAATAHPGGAQATGP